MMCCYLVWISSLKRSMNHQKKNMIILLLVLYTSMASVKRNGIYFGACRVTVDPYLISSITVERESIWLPPTQYLRSLSRWVNCFFLIRRYVHHFLVNRNRLDGFFFFSKRRRRKTWIFFPAESFEWRQVGWPMNGTEKKGLSFVLFVWPWTPNITLFLRSLFSVLYAWAAQFLVVSVERGKKETKRKE